MKFGSAFFGWLAATGLAVLLIALVAGATTAVGLTTNVNTTNPSSGQVQTLGLAGAITLLVIIFLLSLFMLTQFFLGQEIQGKDTAMQKLN